MSMTAEQIEAKAKEIAALFDDGFQLSDIAIALPKAMEIAEGVSGIDGPSKANIATALFTAVINMVDLPGPDVIARPILLALLPTLMSMICSASKGELAINKQER